MKKFRLFWLLPAFAAGVLYADLSASGWGNYDWSVLTFRGVRMAIWGRVEPMIDDWRSQPSPSPLPSSDPRIKACQDTPTNRTISRLQYQALAGFTGQSKAAVTLLMGEPFCQIGSNEFRYVPDFATGVIDVTFDNEGKLQSYEFTRNNN